MRITEHLYQLCGSCYGTNSSIYALDAGDELIVSDVGFSSKQLTLSVDWQISNCLRGVSCMASLGTVLEGYTKAPRTETEKRQLAEKKERIRTGFSPSLSGLVLGALR